MTVGLVCLPGLLCTPDVWGPVARHVDVPMVAPDLPDLDSIERIAATLLPGFPDRFVLVGFSMGGYVALEILSAAPQRVAGLVLAATSAAADTDQQKIGRQSAVEQARSAGMTRFAKGLARYLLGPSASEDPSMVARIVAMAEEVGLDTFARHQAATAARSDNRDVLARLSCPVAVVAGAADKVISPDKAREMADLVRGAPLTIAPEAGHMLPLEAPALLADAITSILSTVTCRSGVEVHAE
ncbi:pimeloyl-ACP methyl ester carboxylesterase [Amorphus suaedae]